MKNGIELRMQILEKFGVSGEMRSIDFCREAYKFVIGDKSDDAPSDTSVPSAPSSPIAVDLGLPSGTKWADRNVGADRPEDTGLYFSWGNTEGHTPDDGYDFCEDAYKVTSGAKLKGDIDIEHDAAYMNQAEDWHMPTVEQFEELVDSCKFQLCEIRGTKGCRFISKINGNSIFLPFAGSIYGTSLDNRGAIGGYWSASLNSAAYGYYLYFGADSVDPAYNFSRYFGRTVRAVQNAE